jgi:cellulose synthase/poly-beta-1,6-N-acetylglucosamine synthase-like glycosyltransferase
MFLIGSLIVLLWLALFVIIDYFLFRSNEPSQNPNVSYSASDVTFLIAARNEEFNISECLQSIISAANSVDSVSVIIVDDDSEDNTSTIIKQLAAKNSRLNLTPLKNDSQGKKSALYLGLQEVRTKLIYLIDADCKLAPTTLNAALYELNTTSASVVLGLVKYAHKNYFQKLIALEQLNTMAVTQAFTKAERPIMANGGNLLFHQDHISQYRKALKSEIASGDDMFFLEQAVKSGANIAFAEEAVVFTQAPRNCSELISQRVRWAGKAAHYKSLLPKLLPAFVWGVNFSFLVLVIMSIVTNTFLYLGFSLVVLKIVLEYAFHSRWFFRYGQKHRILDAVVLSTIYPFYVSFIGLLYIAKPNYTWKGRYLKKGRLIKD